MSRHGLCLRPLADAVKDGSFVANTQHSDLLLAPHEVLSFQEQKSSLSHADVDPDFNPARVRAARLSSLLSVSVLLPQLCARSIAARVVAPCPPDPVDAEASSDRMHWHRSTGDPLDGLTQIETDKFTVVAVTMVLKCAENSGRDSSLLVYSMGSSLSTAGFENMSYCYSSFFMPLLVQFCSGTNYCS